MDPVRLHLVLNHLPIIGSGLALLALLVGLIRNNATVIRTALGLAIVALVATPVISWSGEEAEERIADAAWLDMEGSEWLDEHEERGEKAVDVLLAALVVCGTALGLGAYRERWLRGAGVVAALALALGLGAGLWAASAGGKIRHSEIRGGETRKAKGGEREKEYEKEER